LVAAGQLIDDDPELAYTHAAHAARLGRRLACVREAFGIAAYVTGRFAEALSELRAYRRISGSAECLPIMADCERGLGRPDRALALLRDPEVAGLPEATRVELLIVASGARRDLGELEAAVAMLETATLRGAEDPGTLIRQRYAYADALLACGRRDEAVRWFAAAADADEEGLTDADMRLEELTGEG
jgi:tetratricopeptide (TPR) repeat protein